MTYWPVFCDNLQAFLVWIIVGDIGDATQRLKQDCSIEPPGIGKISIHHAHVISCEPSVTTQSNHILNFQLTSMAWSFGHSPGHP